MPSVWGTRLRNAVDFGYKMPSIRSELPLILVQNAVDSGEQCPEMGVAAATVVRRVGTKEMDAAVEILKISISLNSWNLETRLVLLYPQ